MFLRDNAINKIPEEKVVPTLLAGLKRKVSPDDRSGGQQAAEHYIRGKMNVVMSVNPRWVGSVNAPILGYLRGDNILESAGQSGVIDNARKRMVAPEIFSDAMLLIDQCGRAVRRRKRSR